MFHKKCSKINFFMIASIALLIYIYIQIKNVRNRNSNLQYTLEHKKPNIKIYNLKKNLDNNISKSINCRQSAPYHQVSVLLCLHDEKKDFISKVLFESGIWEKQIMSFFTFYVKNNPDWLVLDIGANIGTFSLMAAKLGAKVISIEPFYDNVVRLHKSALHENLSDKIILICNALFDKRNQIKLLNENKQNIGGQSLIKYLDKGFERGDLSKNKYLVETILLDDIIDYLPLSNSNKSKLQNNKAIMKIDIEGLEPYVIPMASKLFSILKIQVILMEWGITLLLPNERYRAQQLVNFLDVRGFVPYSYDYKQLELYKWKSWPLDIYWIKKKMF